MITGTGLVEFVAFVAGTIGVETCPIIPPGPPPSAKVPPHLRLYSIALEALKPCKKLVTNLPPAPPPPPPTDPAPPVREIIPSPAMFFVMI
jgi:hypothetical protein